MAIGRISGPLLAQNLLRNGVDLAFETDLLYLDVTNGRIGIKQSAPKAELDVNGDILAHRINVNTATIGLTTIESSETSSTISTLLGPLNVVAGVNDLINLYSNVELYGSLHATGNITADGNIVLGDTTSSDTLIVEAEIKSDLLPSLSTGTGTVVNTSTVISPYSIGSTSSFWLKGYFDTVLTNKIAPGTGTDVTVFPNPIQNLDGSAKNLFTINGDIRVYGGNPIGTAPVVSNILYVTMDGNDDNDGRAEDASRACRTVSGAVKSPYYKEGTIIKVRSGHYYEDNPIELLPYTAVVGDDLRTTFLEPINKDTDLFWVNSGVYIAQMAFLNLRRGSVTRYAPGGTGEYETGAYCVAFPPKLDNPIDVYHSPYIQNCTNQSGPWLYDGTMFVPNHTVQVPRVWGTGTYQANTTTVIFHKNTACVEMIELGDAINGAGILIDPAIPNAVVTHISRPDTSYLRAQTLLEKNKAFIQAEVIGFLSANFPTVVYDANTCKRDVGLVVDAITYDAILGGNRKSVTAGVSYYNGNDLVIAASETTATIAAFQYVNTIVQKILVNAPPTTSYQNNVYQYIDTNLYGAEVAGPAITARINDIVDIIQNWAGIENAAALISANKSFIQTEVIAFLDDQYTSLNYDRGICYRDVGLIIDAIQYDLLHKSNVQSIIAAESYWEGVTSIIAGEQYETAAAIRYARDLTSNIVSNITATTYQSTVTQVITTSLSGGVLALPSIQSNFNMIATVVTSGTNYLPTSTNSTLTNFLLTLSTVTVGVSTTGSVYIGDTYVYPVLEKDIPNRWDGGNAAESDRRIDPHGSGGGALVDGNAPSTRSPIQSFVFDAFTQLTQGGHGVHIINNGYAQLVSVFTIFNDIAVHCESGGIASITNSNSNFGDLCLVAEGFGKKEFNGTIYNAPGVAYDPNSNTLSEDENYPLGYFPRYQEVAVFIPDSKNRPHISLVMEVVPPDYIIDYEGQTVPYRNEQGFDGFLAAISNTGTLVQGSYTISGIDTTGIAVGHTLNVRNQYGETSYQSVEYVSSGTVVTHVGYKTVTLNKPIQKGDPGEKYNENYFNLYFSGNAYYTILSSILGPSPIPPGQNKIRGQEDETVAAIEHLKTIAAKVVSNVAVSATYQTSVGQVIDPAYSGGSATVSFINSELDAITGIILQGPSATPIVKTTGTFVAGSSAAIALLTKNRKFLASEVLAFTTSTYQNFQFNNLKCYRDVQLMVDAICEDLVTGGNFKACEAGNTYYSKDGTYHIVTIEEGVTNPLLFPDGCKVNFYQRSYMSASGYLFEYVGAGTDYGALPQVGRVDPVQSKEVVQVNNGKVFFTSTDQNGDYRIGPGLVISQATGVLSGRTFQKSLFAEMTPFILAVEAGGGE